MAENIPPSLPDEQPAAMEQQVDHPDRQKLVPELKTQDGDRVMHGVSANSPLPPSVETAYYRKCIELKRRINEIEENNDAMRLKKIRIERAIMKMRLERSMLLEGIQKRMKGNPDDSDESDSPPPTDMQINKFDAFDVKIELAGRLNYNLSRQSYLIPQDRPLRSKRAHRKGTPPPPGAAGAAPNSSPPPGQDGPPADGAAETPIPGPVFRSYQPASETPAPTNGEAADTPMAPATGGPSGFAAINNPTPSSPQTTANGTVEAGGAGPAHA